MGDVWCVLDVFQRYDSTGTGRILQNDLYKFMKQMHADNRQPAVKSHAPAILRSESSPSSHTTSASLLACLLFQ